MLAWDDQEKKRNEAEKTGVKLTNLYASDFSEIELIVLTTPSGYHSEQTQEAAKLGINICTENKHDNE